jgi:hypothetical protein
MYAEVLREKARKLNCSHCVEGLECQDESLEFIPLIRDKREVIEPERNIIKMT